MTDKQLRNRLAALLNTFMRLRQDIDKNTHVPDIIQEELILLIKELDLRSIRLEAG